MWAAITISRFLAFWLFQQLRFWPRACYLLLVANANRLSTHIRLFPSSLPEFPVPRVWRPARAHAVDRPRPLLAALTSFLQFLPDCWIYFAANVYSIKKIKCSSTSKTITEEEAPILYYSIQHSWVRSYSQQYHSGEMNLHTPIMATPKVWCCFMRPNIKWNTHDIAHWG